MSALTIDIIVFGLCLLAIPMLWIILKMCPEQPLYWKLGLSLCMVLLAIGMVTMLVPAYAPYAPIIRMLGVFLMIGAGLASGLHDHSQQLTDPVSPRLVIIQGIVFVVATALVAIPFFTILPAQQEVKSGQYGIVGMILRVETKLDRLQASLEQAHLERMDAIKRDSLGVIRDANARDRIYKQLDRLEGQQNKSLNNDKNVARDLKKATVKANSPNVIFVPQKKGIPSGNFSIPIPNDP